MGEWNSNMDEAPKELGEPILLWSEMWEMTWGIQIGQYQDGQWLCGEGEVDEDDEFAPTHWQPLPSPPEDS